MTRERDCCSMQIRWWVLSLIVCTAYAPSHAELSPCVWTDGMSPPGFKLMPSGVLMKVNSGETWQQLGLFQYFWKNTDYEFDRARFLAACARKTTALLPLFAVWTDSIPITAASCKIFSITTTDTSLGDPYEWTLYHLCEEACPANERHAHINDTACLCLPGYSREQSTGECRACEAGTLKGDLGDFACTPCPEKMVLGLAQDFRWQMAPTCLPCPATMTASASPQTTCVCTAGFANTTGGCVLCPAGKFKTGDGNETCTACPENTYSAEVGRNSSTCTSCPAFSSTVGGINTIGNVAITNCGCLAGTAGPGPESCLPCEQGTYAHSRWHSCVACPPGQSTPGTGSAAVAQCVDCPRNTYSGSVPPSGAVTCIPCGGNSSSVAKSSSAEQCLCDPRFSRTGSEECVACPAGTHKSVQGDGECTPCIAGRYSEAVAGLDVAVCKLCTAGKTTPEGSGSSHDCTCARGSVESAHGGCICDAGYGMPNTSLVCSGFNDRQCSLCPVTTTRHQETVSGVLDARSFVGGDACQWIMRASLESVASSAVNITMAMQSVDFSVANDRISFLHCIDFGCVDQRVMAAMRQSFPVLHSWKTEVYSSHAQPLIVQFQANGHEGVSRGDDGFTAHWSVPCSACVPGKYKAGTGRGDCVACEEGKYQKSAAQRTCVACPVGKYASERGTSADCTACPPKSTSALGSTRCTCFTGWASVSPNATDALVCARPVLDFCFSLASTAGSGHPALVLACNLGTRLFVREDPPILLNTIMLRQLQVGVTGQWSPVNLARVHLDASVYRVFSRNAEDFLLLPGQVQALSGFTSVSC